MDTTTTDTADVDTSDAGAAVAALDGRATPTALPFVVHEYRSLRVPVAKEALHRDARRAFGWTVESSAPPAGPGGVLTSSGSVVLRMTRDRALRHREVLRELERTAEAALDRIARLERSHTTLASVLAVTIGLLGTGYLAASVFLLDPGPTTTATVLGVVGLVHWGLAFVVHRRVSATRTRAVAPLIDRQYDVLHDSCERAASLLGDARRAS